jgi:thimet oligopeptidase
MIPDYTAITPDTIRARVDDAIREAEQITISIVAAEPTWDSTIQPLEDIADLMARTYGTTAFLGYVHPDEATRDAGHEAEERISKFGIELAFRRDLYEAVAAYLAGDDASARTGEEARLLEFVGRDFRDAGQHLPEPDRLRLRQLSDRLVELGVAFERNVAEHEDALVVTREDLEGMSEAYIETLEEEGGSFRITLAYPHSIPFLDRSPRRDLREELARKFNTRAVEENRPLLTEAVAIRREIAGLFGLPTWAHKVLRDRMAETPERVAAFYADLVPPLSEAGQGEIEVMSQLLAGDTGDGTLMPFDTRYYDTMIRRQEHGIDQNLVAEYFPLESVLDGLFRVTGEVFGLRYREVEVEAWHPDVRTFAIEDVSSDSVIAHFSMDLFPRQGKFSHAAVFPLVPGRRLNDGSYQRPYAAIVANFTKPTATRPSLLQHTEVETFFHEFGHILHQTLTKSRFVRFSGTRVERDFVEAPSQIMEHWTWSAEVLSTFARHHETGEPIPVELIEQLVGARRLNIAVDKLRQMTYGMLDQDLHGVDSGEDLDAILRRTWAVTLLPFHEGTFYPASFTHLFGYEAGYYGYLWSEVYGDDMFSRFEEEGVLSPRVGMDYRREILEAGGTRPAMEHLRAFLGRDPNATAFLRKLAIT